MTNDEARLVARVLTDVANQTMTLQDAAAALHQACDHHNFALADNQITTHGDRPKPRRITGRVFATGIVIPPKA